MPISGSSGYRSGIVTLPNRVRLREMDSRLGMYPTIARTGDEDRKGNFNVTPFDDRETIAFNNSVQNVMYGSLAISGSAKSLEPYAGNNDPNGGLSGAGKIISSISDNTRMTDYKELSSRKNDVENLSFFDDSRINLLGTSSFYMTGTDDSIYPGFTSKLHDKTIIKISLNNNQDVILGNPSGYNPSNTADTRQYQAYYNFNTSYFEPRLGIGRMNTEGDAQTALLTGSIGFGTICGLTIFSASRVATAADDGLNAGDLAANGSMTYALYPKGYYQSLGSPISSFGFPDAEKYHATGSLTFKMSDYITQPFLLEKITVKMKLGIDVSTINESLLRLVSNLESIATVNNGLSPTSDPGTIDQHQNSGAGRSPANAYGEDLGIKAVNFTTFFLRQFSSKKRSFSVTTNDTLGNTLTVTHDTGIQNTQRELISYGKTIIQRGVGLDYLANHIDFDTVVKNAEFDLNIIVPDSTDTVKEVIIEFTPKNLPARRFSGHSEIERLSSDSASKTTVFSGWSGGARNNVETTSPRSLISTTGDKNNLSEIIFANGEGYSNTGVALPKITVNEVSVDKSPYTLMPEDEIIFGVEISPPFSMWNSNRIQPSTVTIKEGPVEIQIFGSSVKNNLEFHDTLNQPLTSEAIHESVGQKESLCLDQYLISTRGEYSGSYLDNFATGSVGAGVRSLVGSAENVLSGSFQRFVKCNNNKDRYYDTMLPLVTSLMKEKNVGTVEFIEKHVAFPDNSIKIILHNQASEERGWQSIFAYDNNISRQVDSSLTNIQTTELILGPLIKQKSNNAVKGADYFSVIGTDATQFHGRQYTKRVIDTNYVVWGFGSKTGAFSQLDSSNYTIERPRGWKYGIWNAFRETTGVIYRPDRFTGQYADIIQQQYDTRFFDEKTNTLSDPPVKIKFVLPDDEKEAYLVLDENEATVNTFESSNISIYATSSLPYFDDGTSPRNRSYSNLANRVIEVEV